MKIKLQFLGFILALILASTQLETKVVPNQQIIVEFSDSELHNDSRILDQLTKDLNELGISNLNIIKKHSGKFLLTYFSNTNITDVKKKLSTTLNHDISISNNKNSDENQEEQKVKFKIQHLDKNGLPINGLNGTSVAESSFKSNRLDSNLFDYLSTAYIHNQHLFAFIINEKKRIYNQIFLNDLLANKLPEVRAGPFITVG